MKIQHSTASCKVNFNVGDHMQNTPLTPKKVHGEAHSETRTFRYMPYKTIFKIAVGDCGMKNKYISTEIFFKIPQRAGVASIPLAALLKTHLGVEVDPQDGKSLCVCVK